MAMTDISHARQVAGPGLKKFDDPDRTADGTPRAAVAFSGLETLWFNTGTLCNLACAHCYMESSPTNDRFVYLTADEVRAYLDEIVALRLATKEIGFTGGEPFLNPDMLEMLRAALAAGFRVLVLTNAMRPMQLHKKALLALQEAYGSKLVVRVSMDHYGKALHDKERGDGTWEKTLDGIKWLSRSGFTLCVAGRTCWDETVDALREGYGRLFRAHDIDIDATCADALVLFPEMDMAEDVPEITEACWDRLGVAPGDIMCATSRMVVKRKGAAHPVVQACTLIAHDTAFEMGRSLQDAASPVKLNHPHCARFCVLGGGLCSHVS